MRKFGSLLIATLFIVGSAIPGDAYAAKGKGKKGVKFNPITIRSELAPVEGAAADLSAASGDLRYNLRKRVIQLKAVIDLPIPAESLGIADADGAGAAQISLELSRDDTVYATCSLELVGIETEEESSIAKYRLHQKKAGKSEQEVKGSCDSFPAIQDGDKMVVFGMNGEARVDILDNQ
jgi:hypothetical protein